MDNKLEITRHIKINEHIDLQQPHINSKSIGSYQQYLEHIGEWTAY